MSVHQEYTDIYLFGKNAYAENYNLKIIDQTF